ncbi:MAG: carbohydrate kinase [Kiritimatiellales bacterium]|nr:carbohydrate kinase [Kiritimatiellota bacterium]MBL7011422.1 carbohydrate kinase [Kiritimatiellales bacterium]
MMILVLGEILFDELPEGNRPGGAPFNFARHLNHLGCDVRFVSSTGRDENGVALLKVLLESGLNPNWVQRHPKAATGGVSVTLNKYGVPAYEIAANVAYDFIDFEELPAMSPELVYFGSLIQRTAGGRKRLHRFLETLPESVLRFYDVNFRDGCVSKEIVVPSLEQTDVLKLNDEELPMIGKLTGSALTEDKLADWLMERFSIRHLALTRGADGCALYCDGQKFEEPPGPLKKEDVIDTVGAGDSFAAVLAHGILTGTNPRQILKRATRLAEFVCTVPGAVPDDDSFYQSLLENPS